MFSKKHVSFISSTISFVIFPYYLQTLLQSSRFTLLEIQSLIKYLFMLSKISKYFCPLLKEIETIKANREGFGLKPLLALKISFYFLQTPVFDIPKLSLALQSRFRNKTVQQSKNCRTFLGWNPTRLYRFAYEKFRESCRLLSSPAALQILSC